MEALGDVPLERIIFDPWPGTATEADLLRKIEVEDQICELIDGTLVEKAMGFYESVLAMILIQELLNFIRPRNLGVVGGGDGPLRLRLNLVRLPDVSFISSARVRAAGGIREQIPSLVPDLAVEVLSPSNRPGEMKRKREHYFESGVRLVWIINPETRTAEAHTSLNERETIKPDGLLDGRDVLPGFQLQLSELFAAADRMVEA